MEQTGMHALTVIGVGASRGDRPRGDRRARPGRARGRPAGASGGPRSCRSAAGRGWRERTRARSPASSVDLFDATATLHGLGPSDRELLESAALLHDIGEHVSRDGHARHTAYLIENGGLRGFSPDEVNMLASLARYHVRGRPRESFGAWEQLDRGERDRVVKLLALLRMADGLDAAHSSAVGHVGVELGGDGLEIVITSQGEAELERWLLQRKKRLFEELFEVPVSLEVVPSGPDELPSRRTEGAGLG